jgi:hypothetical protein
MDIGDHRNFPKPHPPETPETNASAGSADTASPKIETKGVSVSPGIPTHESMGDLLMEFGDLGAAATSKRISGEDRSRRWAILLMNDSSMEGASTELIKDRFLDWLTHSTEGALGQMPTLPEVFQTTRFWNEIKAIDSPVRFLKTILDNLRSESLTFYEAVDCTGRSFGWEEERLSRWKQGLESLAGFKRWLPAFIHAYDYLTSAFSLNNDRLDQLREQLLRSLDEPHRLLDPKVRIDFDNKFLMFKKTYMDSYFLLHEEALHVTSGFKRDEAKVDPIALRNLELLSSLPHVDQSFLNRVKLLARWIQRHQCNLPVDQILELYPRCYCNFNPTARQNPTSSAVPVNTLIQNGLEYFRAVLRRCGHWILRETNVQSSEEECQKQITALLEDGPMIPLKPATIETLKRIVASNPSEFLSEIRKMRK